MEKIARMRGLQISKNSNNNRKFQRTIRMSRYEWNYPYRRIADGEYLDPSDHRRIKIPLTLSNDRNEISARAKTRHLFPSTGDR